MRTKQLLEGVGIATPAWRQIQNAADCAGVAAELGCPLIVKPALEGSSIGMSKVMTADELPAAWELAARSGSDVFAEAWVQRTKHEVLNHFIVFGERHLRHILSSWLDYYHRHRPHQGIGNVPISASLPPPEPLEQVGCAELVCHDKLGGLLKHFERKAA